MSPQLLLIETRVDMRTWNDSLTATWKTDPANSGIKVRYRPSSQIRRAFAHIEATAADIAAVRARKGRVGSNPSIQDPPTLQATISIPLGTCGPLEQWLPAFMEQVAAANNIPLQRSTTEHGLDIHKWRPIMTYHGNWTGKVVIQLASQQEVGQLHASIHGKGVEVQKHLAGITVDSLHIDLATQSQSE